MKILHSTMIKIWSWNITGTVAWPVLATLVPFLNRLLVLLTKEILSVPASFLATGNAKDNNYFLFLLDSFVLFSETSRVGSIPTLVPTTWLVPSLWLHMQSLAGWTLILKQSPSSHLMTAKRYQLYLSFFHKPVICTFTRFSWETSGPAGQTSRKWSQNTSSPECLRWAYLKKTNFFSRRLAQRRGKQSKYQILWENCVSSFSWSNYG